MVTLIKLALVSVVHKIDNRKNNKIMYIKDQLISNESKILYLVKKCPACKEFYIVKNLSKQRKQKYCCNDCKLKVLHSRKYPIGEDNPNYNRITLICSFCKNEYIVKNYKKDTSKYCSKKCRDECRRQITGKNNLFWKERIKIKCQYCNNIIEKTPYWASKTKYCSSICSGKAQSQRYALQRKINKCCDCGIEISAKALRCIKYDNLNKRKHQLEYYNIDRKCKSCGEKLTSNNAKECRKCFSKNYRGEKHHAYKGNSKEHERLRKTADYKNWRSKVFERDNYICQECNKRGGNLEAHHIFKFSDYPELRLEISNGITLCKKCHEKTKGREEDYIEFFQSIVEQKYETAGT